MLLDDLGAPVPLQGPARRVVSLVPSLTEALAATDRSLIVGATDWCTHPEDLDVPRVRGTKNPDLRAIAALSPDLVLVNQEENRELDVKRLRDNGIAVWVTVIETLDQAFSSMRRVWTEALGLEVPGWLVEAEQAWAAPPGNNDTNGDGGGAPGPSVAVPVWRDPWMVVGPRTFTGDLLLRLGARHAFDDTAPDADRYPHTDPAAIAASGADLVLLPDEPYVFTADDGPEAFALPTELVSGRHLTWYGPSLVAARADLGAVLARHTGG